MPVYVLLITIAAEQDQFRGGSGMTGRVKVQKRENSARIQKNGAHGSMRAALRSIWDSLSAGRNSV